MIPALTANAAAPAVTGAVMCAVSFAVAREAAPPQAMRIDLPKFNISLPKLPDISLPDLDLPNFGKKKDTTPSAKSKAPPAGSGLTPKGKKLTVPPQRAPSSERVKVRVSTAVRPSNPDAPSARGASGLKIYDTIKSDDGWKRFPTRRMPGANMEGFKDMAKNMKMPGSGKGKK